MSLHAQNDQVPLSAAYHGNSLEPQVNLTSPAQFDPSDLYLQGYLSARAAEKLSAQGDHISAAEKYRKADELFATIRKYYPKWRTEMVMQRSEKTGKALADTNRNAERQLQEKRNVVAELEGGDRKGARETPVDPYPNVLKVDPVASRRLKEAESEVARLRLLLDQQRRDTERFRNDQANGNHITSKQLEKMQKESARQLSATRAEIQRLKAELAMKFHGDLESKRMADLLAAEKLKVARLQHEADSLREQNARRSINSEHKTDHKLVEQSKTITKLRAAEAEVLRLKARLSKAPLEGEVDTLNLRIKRLEQEREAMALSLLQSQNGYEHAMSRIAGLEKELNQARQGAMDLNRNLAAQQNTANEVVAGQRRQLEAMQKLLNEKSEALGAANKQIAKLQTELAQSKDAYAELRDERDALMMERDQMAALLKLGEAGRIQELIEQNMGLAKKLRESNEALERMKRDSDSDKDAITEALRDLAIAKSQINRLRQEKQMQEQRILDLEQRLRVESKALADGEVSADPREVNLLRDIIRRQLRAQTARRQAQDLLMNALRKLGNQDDQLAEVVAMMEAQEIELTPEEQKVVADRQVDGEFISPFARDRVAVNQPTVGLKRDIDVFDRAAKKAFASGRLHPTRELYEMILDQHPGHTPTLCKMGVVQLKLGNYDGAAESFQRANEMDNKNAYSLRMLGYSLMKGKRILEAEKAARQSVDLDPNDAKTHMLLATLCFRLGKASDAESHFKGAINADPLSSEPYYNLALIYCGTGRLQQAQQFYREALERGALPDAQLEEQLAAH